MTTILQVQSALYAGTNITSETYFVLFEPFPSFSRYFSMRRTRHTPAGAEGRPGRGGLGAQVSLSRLMDQAVLQTHLCEAASLSHCVECFATSLMGKRGCGCQALPLPRPPLGLRRSEATRQRAKSVQELEPSASKYASCRLGGLLSLIQSSVATFTVMLHSYTVSPLIVRKGVQRIGDVPASFGVTPTF